MTEELIKITVRCPDCGKTQELEVPSGDNAFSQIIRDSAKACYCEACAEKNRKINRAQEAGSLEAFSWIPERFRVWDQNIAPKGAGKIARFVQKNANKSLFIAGNYGCGKTLSVAYAGFWLIREKLTPVKYLLAPALCKQYAAQMSVSSQAGEEWLEDIRRGSSVLIIDDLGKEKHTESSGELLFRLIDDIYTGRHSARLWVTANKSGRELAARFEDKDTGNAVIDRLRRIPCLDYQEHSLSQSAVKIQ